MTKFPSVFRWGPHGRRLAPAHRCLRRASNPAPSAALRTAPAPPQPSASRAPFALTPGSETQAAKGGGRSRNRAEDPLRADEIDCGRRAQPVGQRSADRPRRARSPGGPTRIQGRWGAGRRSGRAGSPLPRPRRAPGPARSARPGIAPLGSRRLRLLYGRQGARGGRGSAPGTGEGRGPRTCAPRPPAPPLRVPARVEWKGTKSGFGWAAAREGGIARRDTEGRRKAGLRGTGKALGGLCIGAAPG